jgi:hypothetical protein
MAQVGKPEGPATCGVETGLGAQLARGVSLVIGGMGIVAYRNTDNLSYQTG